MSSCTYSHPVFPALTSVAKIKAVVCPEIVPLVCSCQLRYVCPSVYPSFRPHETTRHTLDGLQYNEIWLLCIFRKSVQKMQASLNFDDNYGYFT